MPSDDFILLSFINMRLRDGDDLDEECASLGWEKEALIVRLRNIGYSYDEEQNAFRIR